MSVDPVDWKNYDPVTGVGDPSTPITAENLKRYQAYIESQAGDAAQAAADAAQSAAEAGQQDDAAVAAILEQPATDTRQFLDGRYALAGEVPPGGVDPNDVGYDIIPLLGQSNMVGRGVPTDADPTQPDDPRIFTFGAQGLHANQIARAEEPLQHWGTITAGSVGPGVEFARHYLGTVNPNRRVLLVPCAQGATAFTGGDRRWKVDHAPEHENLYLRALRQIQLALDAAGRNARIVGFLWHQGEGDSGHAGYADDLDALISGLRSELGTPNAWFLIGQMSPAGIALSAGKQGINDVQIDTPRRQYRTAFAYAPYGAHKPGDTTHFSAAGSWALGRSYAAALPLAVANTDAASTPVAPPAVSAFHGAPGALNVEWERPACRFTDFVVEHRAVGATEWTEWAHAASLHNQAVIGGYAIGDSAEVRVSTVNESGTSEPSAVATVAVTGYVDDIAPASPWRGYSMRKLVSSATNAIRVRRSSDGAEADIGFTTAGLLDEDALRTFCGAGDGFVRTWYDQYGVGSLVQLTEASQPRIVTAGVVEKEAGRPVILFDGTDDYLYSTTTGLTTSGMSALLVCRVDLTAGAPRIFMEGSNAADTPMYTFYVNEDGTGGTQFRNDANTMVAVPASEDVWATGAMQILGATDDRSSTRFVRNERVMDPAARAHAGAITLSRFAVGAMFRTTVTNHAAMALSEAIFWQAAHTPGDLEPVVSNQAAHFTLNA